MLDKSVMYMVKSIVKKLEQTYVSRKRKQNYITFIDKVNQTISNAEQSYYSNRFTKSNIRKTWSFKNSIMKGDKTKHIPSNSH